MRSRHRYCRGSARSLPPTLGRCGGLRQEPGKEVEMICVLGGLEELDGYAIGGDTGVQRDAEGLEPVAIHYLAGHLRIPVNIDGDFDTRS